MRYARVQEYKLESLPLYPSGDVQYVIYKMHNNERLDDRIVRSKSEKGERRLWNAIVNQSNGD